MKYSIITPEETEPIASANTYEDICFLAKHIHEPYIIEVICEKCGRCYYITEENEHCPGCGHKGE